MSKGNQYTALFNQNVVNAQPVQRNMTSSGGKSFPGATHSGTLVTTQSGEKYLVHKGPGFSPSNSTVITPASNMSNNWKPVGNAYNPATNVGGMMNNGYYNPLGSNCNNATANQPGSTVTTDFGGRNIMPKK